MRLQLERIYQQPQNTAGYRILVDRLWPRGISKVNAHLDYWFKDIAPVINCAGGLIMNPKSFPYFLKNTTWSYKQTPKLPNLYS